MDREFDTVHLRYAAPSNITFHGYWDTGLTREEWDALSFQEQDDITRQAVYELVEIL